jgi:hypothetical protein
MRRESTELESREDHAVQPRVQGHPREVDHSRLGIGAEDPAATVVVERGEHGNRHR